MDGSYEELLHAADQLTASNAVHHQRLLMFNELMQQEDWQFDSRSFDHWLVVRYQIDRREAHNLVVVASLVRELPRTMALFASGAISWDQLVAICSWAQASDDDYCAEMAPDATLNQIRAGARARRLKDEASDDSFRSRRWLPAGTTTNQCSTSVVGWTRIRE